MYNNVQHSIKTYHNNIHRPSVNFPRKKFSTSQKPRRKIFGIPRKIVEKNSYGNKSLSQNRTFLYEYESFSLPFAFPHKYESFSLPFAFPHKYESFALPFAFPLTAPKQCRTTHHAPKQCKHAKIPTFCTVPRGTHAPKQCTALFHVEHTHQNSATPFAFPLTRTKTVQHHSPRTKIPTFVLFHVEHRTKIVQNRSEQTFCTVPRGTHAPK